MEIQHNVLAERYLCSPTTHKIKVVREDGIGLVCANCGKQFKAVAKRIALTGM